MSELYEILYDKAQITVQYFESNIKKDGSYGKHVNDLCCYFKSPMMFIYANKKDPANHVLGYIYSTFMTKTGDFLTNSSSKSLKNEYKKFWSYTNVWIIRAALQLQHKDLLVSGDRYLTQFNTGNGTGYLTNDPEQKNGVTDVLTTAHHGLINLEAEKLELAISAGNYLCNVLEKQPNINEKFYLSFNKSGEAITNYESNEAAFYCINKKSPNQLYFMIGYPSAYLALLYKKTQNKKYLQAAKMYLDFALTCHQSIFESNYSHKIAWAASIIYGLTGEQKYYTAIEKITDHFIKTQSKNGLWYENDIYSSYDQSAEIACWFLDISNNLKQSEKKIEDNKKTQFTKQSSSWTTTAIKYGVMGLVSGIGLYAVYRKVSHCGENHILQNLLTNT